MSVQAIKMTFADALHIGRGADELDKTATTYGSDALKSALYAVGLPYYLAWQQNPQQFFKGFRISSAFPYCGNNYFLPKPAGMQCKVAQKAKKTQAKKAKKISHISSRLFAQWAAQPNTPVAVEETQIGDGAFIFEKGQASKQFIYTTVQQRVAVAFDGSQDSRPFYFERMFFTPDSGLYFLIQFNDPALQPQVMHALQLLADMGIGTDRTVGNGQFTASEPQPFALPNSQAQGRQMPLGLYLPTKAELDSIDLEQSSWGLIKRGGYMAAAEHETHRSLRKNSIYFFTEGSSFTSQQPLQGKVENLRPKNYNDDTLHPIWRCGMPLFINL